MGYHKLFLFCCLMAHVLGQIVTSYVKSEEKQLVSMLLDKYDRSERLGRPANTSQDTVHVKFDFAMIQLLDLDEKKQVLTSLVWNRFVWHDLLLQWDPNDYGGTDCVRLPVSMLWIPDIVLYNAVQPPEQLSGDFLGVYSTGKVVWIPSYIMRSTCSVDVLNFPFDTQDCFFKYGSWTYNGCKLDLDFLNEDEIDLTDYHPSNGWDIIDNPGKKNVIYYPCCLEPYPDVTYHLKIRRRSEFFGYILILPSLLLASLTFVMFLLPPSSGERIGMGLTIFLSYFMVLLILVESTPHSAAKLPKLGTYLCANMSMITVSIFLASIIANLNENGVRGKPVNKWIRKVFIDVLARIIYSKICTPCPDHKKRLAYNGMDMSIYTSKVTTGNLHQNIRPNKPLDGSSSNTIDEISPDELKSLTEKERQERISEDWYIIAVVLDRLFFIAYLVFVITSLIMIFPKSEKIETDKMNL